MGKRGPAPKPTNLRVLHGEKPYRINKGEPRPDEEQGPPSCPSFLPAYGKTVWKALAQTLWDRGRLVTSWDRQQFAAYCAQVAIHKEATEEIITYGAVMVEERKRFSRSGELLCVDEVRVRNPAVQIQRDAATQMRQYAQEFGLTPSARVGLSVGGESDAKTSERLLS